MSFALTQHQGFAANQMQNATVAFGSTAGIDATQASFSHTGMSIGTAAPDRYVVAMLTTFRNASNFSISSVTIGGITATALYDPGTVTGGVSVALYGAYVPTGTTATVAVTYSASVIRCGCVTWSCNNLTSTVPVGNAYTQTANSGTTITVSGVVVPEGAITIGGAFCINLGAAGTYTWTTLTENADTTIAGASTHSGASLASSAPSSNSIQVTYSQTMSDVSRLAVIVLR